MQTSDPADTVKWVKKCYNPSLLGSHTVLFCTQYVWKCLVFATKYFLSFFQRKLQRVSAEVPLDGVLKGVGTLEELLALLLFKGPLAGVHVFIQQLPELIGQVHHLQILGEPGDYNQ